MVLGPRTDGHGRSWQVFPLTEEGNPSPCPVGAYGATMSNQLQKPDNKGINRAMPGQASLLCAHNPGFAWGHLEQVTPCHLPFSFFPSTTSQLTTHPREERISSFKFIKHFVIRNPWPGVQLANNSVKGDGISGQVRGRRIVDRGRAAAWETS